MKIPEISVTELVERYEVLLLDAYGVLVEQQTLIPGADEFIDRLNRLGKPYYILTNDASRSVEHSAARYHRRGLAIPAERIITSGSLLPGYFCEEGLAGSRCVVLGPEDAWDYVRAGGGEPVPLTADTDADVVVVCDEAGYPFLEHLDDVLTLLFRTFDAGVPPRLVVPNPDAVYPKGHGRFGITAGSIVLVLENALRVRFPRAEPARFVPLGKPHRPIFEEARRRSGTMDMVMVGDQLATDIRGANDFGIASVLVGTGLTSMIGEDTFDEIRPTWLLQSVRPNPSPPRLT
ncbi:MAG: HAD hydrolase-like protein [Acidobacteria bacterium]|nr:HAD hydrolase-like protein [Acidobacteriota bacterium]